MIDPILVWNIRGVGTSKGRLKTLISKWRPKIVALLEHFQNIDVAKRLGRGLRFDNFISNEAEGGKIWIFGDSIIEARLVRMGRQFISLKVGEGAEIFLLTIIYAKFTMVEPRSLWDALSFQTLDSEPCIFVGDFNIIQNDSERRRGGLIEMNSKGNMFSWCNGQYGLAHSWARLDHALMNASFLSIFSNAICSYLPRSTSDHAPMMIELKKDPCPYGPSPFHFQQMWVDHHNFLDCVRQAWSIRVDGTAIQKLVIKLKQTKVALQAWNRRVFRYTLERISTLENQSEELELQSQLNWDANLDNDLQMDNADLAMSPHQEEICLRQMAKIKWATEGDQNTKFFHVCLALKRSKRVLSMRSNDAVFESPESIYQGAVDYFSSFLQGEPTSEHPNLDGLIDPVISDEDNASLLCAPSLEEVYTALLSIPVNSAPGPDGFGSGFYKSCWEVVKNDLWKVMLEFFDSKSLPKFFTASFLVLIPKVDSPTGFDKFRPISLCSIPQVVINKIHQMMSSFFWGELNGKDKKKWVAWKHMGKPVAEGSIGVRLLHEVQTALHMRFA
ncbi:uncharacterized protein LOC122291007 [Carya illinoinensis]|uniref:uncharacterized protein LOC122291007 n=1 Tax=Carya illinoinensis TaxID=32201 RepID=UPI001C71E358|nr:uncharacterized protein LOC122291007 [Carya illinoinensis]